MAANFESIKEKWERMNSRERGLLTILALALIIGIVGSMIAKVRSDMATIEARNQDSRKALKMLALYRISKARASSTGTDIKIPDKAVELDTYVDGIVNELGLTSPTLPLSQGRSEIELRRAQL